MQTSTKTADLLSTVVISHGAGCKNLSWPHHTVVRITLKNSWVVNRDPTGTKIEWFVASETKPSPNPVPKNSYNSYKLLISQFLKKFNRISRQLELSAKYAEFPYLTVVKLLSKLVLDVVSRSRRLQDLTMTSLS